MSRRESSPRHRRSEESPSRSRPKHRYRVRMRRLGASADVIWLTNDLQYASEIAASLNSRAGQATAWVEQFTLSAHPPRWQEVRREGEPQQSERKHSLQRAPALRSGDVVQAVLLPERTRRGGWKAQLIDTGFIGPITNSEAVPTTAMPNAVVSLRIGAANRDGTHLQLVWKG